MLHAGRWLTLMILVVSGLAACDRQLEQTEQQAAPDATVAQAVSSAPPALAPSPASSVALEDVHEEAETYRVLVTYPKLQPNEAGLAKELLLHTRHARMGFRDGRPDPDQYPRFRHRQLDLILDYTVASRLPRFVSVRCTGMVDMGGAHPMPIDTTFVFDHETGKMVYLTDLFSKPDLAYQRLSDFARGKLMDQMRARQANFAGASDEDRQQWLDSSRQMIEQGTEPVPDMFSEFTVLAGADHHAIGLQLIFPPYQVAPYADGTQIVDVPLQEFEDLLKPAYRRVFSD